MSLVFDPADALLDFHRGPFVLLHIVRVSDVDPLQESLEILRPSGPRPMALIISGRVFCDAHVTCLHLTGHTYPAFASCWSRLRFCLAIQNTQRNIMQYDLFAMKMIEDIENILKNMSVALAFASALSGAACCFTSPSTEDLSHSDTPLLFFL